MLQLTAGLAVAARVVVCRAPSGHVAIESVLAGDCCPADHEELSVHELRADTCDGCLDTPLLHAAISTPSKVSLAALASAPWSLAPVVPFRRAPSVALPVAVSIARLDRTVVLLI